MKTINRTSCKVDIQLPMKKIIPLLLITLILVSCGMGKFKEKADSQFADQHFKTAIANIELYKIRYGYYPLSLDSLTFLGDWDKMIFMSLKYQKLSDGYQLDVVSNGMNASDPKKLNYPLEFWQGLGIRKSNVMKNGKRE